MKSISILQCILLHYQPDNGEDENSCINRQIKRHVFIYVF